MSETDQFQEEIVKGDRFEFGKNWKHFLENLSEWQIVKAEDSLKHFLKLDRLDGMSFLDAGCGSGLFSLAAKRLGATVVSFDYDPSSVSCAEFLKDRYFAADQDWTVQQGSVLDESFLDSLGQFDIVYSWGVLHHTGHMWDAIANVSACVKPEGLFFTSIYNHQSFFSAYWTAVKKLYNKIGATGKKLMECGYIAYFASALFIADLIRLRNPMERHGKTHWRGMTLARNVVDWIGGWPFEVAKPEEIFDCLRDRGFRLEAMKTCGANHGCNEFLFKKSKG